MSRLYDLMQKRTHLPESTNVDSASTGHGMTDEPVIPADEFPVSSSDQKPLISIPLNGMVQNGMVQKGGFASAGKLHLDRKMPSISNVVDSSVIEHYRRLRTKILQQQTAKPFRTLVVTSPAPEEGKTLTVLNLGWSFAMLPSFKILLVDGDLRRGSLGNCLGVEKRPGLSNFVDGSAKLEDVILKCEDLPLHFVGRGDSKIPPAELLQSSELKTRFRELAEPFSLVLVDSPPANVVTDVQLLAGSCDAVLLLARAFTTTKKAFEKAIQDVSSFRVIGTVLNGATKTQLYRRYKGYY